MRFDAAWVLFLIPPALLLAAALQWYAAARRQKLLARFGESGLVEKLTRGVQPARRRLRFVLWIGAIAAILFALARPQYGVVERPMRRRGVEVVIAIDCSYSMLGQDIEPNRLTRAREQLRGLIQRLEGDSVAIIAFGGAAVVQCPMTSDYDMALNLLDAIDVDTVPVQGTAIGRAVKKAIETYKTAGKGYKVLVLLTDGEDHEGDPVARAKEAADAGVIIHAIGLGSPEGAPIPLPEGGFKESQAGVKVNTRLDFATLAEMAYATGGTAVLAHGRGEDELDTIYRAIGSLKEENLQSQTEVVHKERFQWFLLVALSLLLADLLLREGRSAQKTVLSLLLALSLFSTTARAGSPRRLNNRGVEQYEEERYGEARELFEQANRENPENPLFDYNRAASLLKEEAYDEALAGFEKAASARNPALAARGNVGRGIAAYRQAETLEKAGELQKALQKAEAAWEANKQALRLQPENDASRVNLELASRLRKRLEQQLQQQKQQQQQEKKEDEQDRKKDQQQEQEKDQTKQDQQKQSPEKQQNQQNQEQNLENQQQNAAQQNEEKEQQSPQEHKQQQQENQQNQQPRQDETQDATQQASKDEQQKQMEKDATLNILNLLDDNDTEALKRMLRQRYGGIRRPEKDW